MNIEAVYHRARVIENPDCSSLKREILDKYVIDPAVLLSIGEDDGDYVSETYGAEDTKEETEGEKEEGEDKERAGKREMKRKRGRKGKRKSRK